MAQEITLKLSKINGDGIILAMLCVWISQQVWDSLTITIPKKSTALKKQQSILLIF